MTMEGLLHIHDNYHIVERIFQPLKWDTGLNQANFVILCQKGNVNIMVEELQIACSIVGNEHHFSSLPISFRPPCYFDLQCRESMETDRRSVH